MEYASHPLFKQEPNGNYVVKKIIFSFPIEN
jgi:hypothetical protein